MKFVISLIVIIVGFTMVWKTEAYLRAFGRSEWAEGGLHIWGGSRLLIKLIGIAAIFLAFLNITGLLGPLVDGIIGGLFRR